MKVKALFGIFFLVGAIALGHIGFRISGNGIRFSRNFSAVEAGKLYRSAQLTGSELRNAIAQYGIKSVINLQGKRPGYGWFDDEAKTLRELGVTQINLEMTVQSIPKRLELLKLLEAYKTLERPILVHCRQGSDRTGEAVAIYQMEYMNKTREEALKSFSFRHYYVELFAPAKRYFVENYQGKEWAYTDYDHCDRTWKYADQRECP